MANKYIQEVEGGENTNPDGTEGIELDNGIISKWVKINNLFDGAPTQGDIIYFNGTKWKRLAAGTDGYVLTAGGAGANPAWEATGSADYIGEKRLSLTSSTPVTTGNVTAATTVYWTDGTTNLSVAVPSTTSTPFDVYYSISGNTLSTVDWTNDTTRATALTRSGGKLVKTGDTDKLYIGTGRTTTVSGQCEDSTSRRLLWNYYNRRTRPLLAVDTTDTWNYTTDTWRSRNASTTDGVGRFTCVIGVSEELTTAYNFNVISNASAVAAEVGVGIDSTNTNAATVFGSYVSAGSYANTICNYQDFLAAGYHFIQALERSQAVGTTTWRGDAGSTFLQTGMTGVMIG